MLTCGRGHDPKEERAGRYPWRDKGQVSFLRWRKGGWALEAMWEGTAGEV